MVDWIRVAILGNGFWGIAYYLRGYDVVEVRTEINFWVNEKSDRKSE
jgi:hypothetical protein